MRRGRPNPFPALAVFVLATHTGAAACPEPEPFSACLDANALWLRSGRGSFAGLGSARATPEAAAGIAFGLTLLQRPLVLEVQAPAGVERELALVERAVDQHLLLWFGLPHRLTLDVALISVLRQTGAGPDVLRSQRAPALTRSAVRDARLGLGHALLELPALSLSVRAEVALPTGDADAFVSSGSPTWSPSTTLEWRAEPFVFGVELGARLRRAVELGTLRHGSQLHAAAGVALRLSSELALSVEAFALPSLIDSTSARGREFGVSTRSLPAEWLGLLRWSPPGGASVALGAGSGLPLGSESHAGTRERSLSATSPDFRALCDLRYAP